MILLLLVGLAEATHGDSAGGQTVLGDAGRLHIAWAGIWAGVMGVNLGGSTWGAVHRYLVIHYLDICVKRSLDKTKI